MNPPPQQRRLAAIMFTDMVGYSALAHELLEEHRANPRFIALRKKVGLEK